MTGHGDDGRDILISGNDVDSLRGGLGDDLLIGSGTNKLNSTAVSVDEAIDALFGEAELGSGIAVT